MPNRFSLTLCGIIGCAMLGAGVMAQDDFDVRPQPGSTDRSEYQGFTVPSKEVEIGFSQPGLIREVLVKDGDVVKTGDVLAVQDDIVERASLAKEEYLLKSNVQLRAAEANRDLAQVEFDRIQGLYKNGSREGAASKTEFEKARVELIIAKLKIELAKEETETKRLEIERLKAQLDRMKAVSTVDGIVRKVEVAPGEIADPQKPSVILVLNNPLKVETNLPIAAAKTMKVGQSLQVRYADEKQWREARIQSFDPVADATAGTQLVILELPNAEGERAGHEMVVKLPQNLAAAAAAAAATPKD